MTTGHKCLTTPRRICSQCLYPCSTCLCSSIARVACQSQIDIIQHVSEAKSAKNTARLIRLCIPESNIWLGDTEEDFLPLIESIKSDTRKILILYPRPGSTDLSTIVKKDESTTDAETGEYQQKKYRLILLDGTWKKSYRLWMNNSWLENYQTVFLNNYISSYHIRKAPKPHCLSTIEALAFSLNVLEPAIDTAPLFKIFQAMQSNFLRRYSIS